jgi:cation transport regulator ChaC
MSAALAHDDSSAADTAALFHDVSKLLSTRERNSGPLWLFAYASLIWRPDLDHTIERVAALGGFRRRLWQACPVHRGTSLALGRVATLVPASSALRWAAVALPHHPQDEPAAVALGARALELWLRGHGGAPATRNNEVVVVHDDVFGDNDDASGDEMEDEEWPVVYGTAYCLLPSTLSANLQRLCQRERAGYRPRLVRIALDDSTSVEALTFCSESGSKLWTRETNTQVANVIARAVGASGRNIDYLAFLIAAMRKRGVFDQHLEQVFCLLDIETKDLVLATVLRELHR